MGLCIQLPKLILFPANSSKAYENILATVKRPVKLTTVRPLIRDKLIARLQPHAKDLRVWGATPRRFNKQAWERFEEGDLCVFFRGDGFILSARVVTTDDNPALARKLWGGLQKGGTWNLVTFLSDVLDISTSLARFARDAGYGAGYVPRKTIVVKNLITQRLVKKYGSVEGAFGLVRSDARADWQFVCSTPSDFTELISAVQRQMKSANQSVAICNPYVDGSTFSMFLAPVSETVRVRMIIASDKDDIRRKVERGRLSIAQVSAFTKGRRFETRVSDGLHSRFIVIDGRGVILLSADLMKDQFTNKYSYAFSTENRSIADGCVSFFERIWRNGTPGNLIDLASKGDVASQQMVPGPSSG